jgi:glycosyltransferase involved in cell wall biosynthesis
MNIAFGIEVFYPETNGVITASINLAENLIALGHKIYFFVPKNSNYKEEELKDGIKIVRIPSIPSGIYPGVRLCNVHSPFVLEAFKKYEIDIVHEMGPWLVCASMSNAAKQLKIPVLVTHHTLIDNPVYIQYGVKSRRLALLGQKVVWQALLNPCYKTAQLITAPSISTCDDISSLLKPPRKVEFISNGIEVSRFLKPEPSCDLPKIIPPEYIGKNSFVFVGRQGYEKSIDTLLQAMAQLVLKHPEAKLLLIGSGPAEKDFKELSDTLKLNESVFFAGRIPNDELIGSHLLKKEVAFVTASLTENQPMTVIEALCSGCPCIVPDDPHMLSIVDKESGWIFLSGQVESLSETMAYVLEHPEDREEKAKHTQRNIEHFDGMNVALKFQQLYQDCLKSKPL